MDDQIRQAGKFVQETVLESARQATRERGEDKYIRGFSGAVGIVLRRIDEKLGAFREQMKGPGLTKAEQAAYAQLNELKSEIEADCDRYWRGSGVDWRPLKSVAKRVAQQTEEPGRLSRSQPSNRPSRSLRKSPSSSGAFTSSM